MFATALLCIAARRQKGNVLRGRTVLVSCSGAVARVFDALRREASAGTLAVAAPGPRVASRLSAARRQVAAIYASIPGSVVLRGDGRAFCTAKTSSIPRAASLLTIQLDLCARRREPVHDDPIPDRRARFNAHVSAVIEQKRAERRHEIDLASSLRQ